MIFLITTKKSDPENIGKAAKIMYLGVLEPVIWSSIICTKYMGRHFEFYICKRVMSLILIDTVQT